MSSARSYVCACGGLIKVPRGRTKITIEQVRQHHDMTCPARRERKS